MRKNPIKEKQSISVSPGAAAAAAFPIRHWLLGEASVESSVGGGRIPRPRPVWNDHVHSSANCSPIRDNKDCIRQNHQTPFFNHCLQTTFRLSSLLLITSTPSIPPPYYYYYYSLFPILNRTCPSTSLSLSIIPFLLLKYSIVFLIHATG